MDILNNPSLGVRHDPIYNVDINDYDGGYNPKSERYSKQVRENEAIRVYRYLMNTDRMVYGGAAYKRMRFLERRNSKTSGDKRYRD
jgi:hypothetical protein